MKKSRFIEGQIMAIRKQHEAGVQVADLSREHNISTALIYQWRSKYGGMNGSMMRRLKELEALELPPKEDVCRRTDQSRVAPGSPRGKVVRPFQRREMAKKGVAKHGISVRLACVVYGMAKRVTATRLRSMARTPWLTGC